MIKPNPNHAQNSQENSEPKSHWESYDAVSIPKSNLNLIFKEIVETEEEAFIAWKKEADFGFAEAQYQLGNCYEEGFGVHRSYTKAFHYFMLASNEGHSSAQKRLAMLFENGLGVEQSDSLAFKYYQLAAEQGDSVAQAQLGNFYAEGKGVEESKEEAIRYYQMAANRDSPSAWRFLAKAYEEGSGVEKSQDKAAICYQNMFNCKKQVADAGDAGSQVAIGWYFEKGVGVEKSIESAVHYYKLAALQNFPRAFYHLAQCFEKGNGVQKSFEQAIYYYELAIKQGDVLAQLALSSYFLDNKINDEQGFNYLKLLVQSGLSGNLLASSQMKLGECFEKGLGVKKSAQNALYYYKLSAENGNERSQNRLGNAYSYGELDIEKSPEQAIHYYKLAVDQNYIPALKSLAKCYENGFGVEKSHEKFIYYSELADNSLCNEFIETKRKADLGSATDQFDIGLSYSLGTSGTPESPEKAFYYYKLAADQGLSSAMYYVGEAYLIGYGVPLSYEKAFYYHKLAADLGDVSASRRVGYYYLRGTESEKIDYEKALYYLETSINNQGTHAEKYISKYYLGKIFENGYGVEQSVERAFSLYQEASEKEYDLAAYDLGRCYEHGIGTEKSWEKAIQHYNEGVALGNCECINRLRALGFIIK